MYYDVPLLSNDSDWLYVGFVAFATTKPTILAEHPWAMNPYRLGVVETKSRTNFCLDIDVE
jgi:hypothetical protein